MARRIAFIAVGLLVLLSAAALVWLTVAPPALDPLIPRAEVALTVPPGVDSARVGGMRLRFPEGFLRPAFRLTDVTLSGGGGALRLRCPSAIISVRLSDLIAGRPRPAEVTLQAPILELAAGFGPETDWGETLDRIADGWAGAFDRAPGPAVSVRVTDGTLKVGDLTLALPRLTVRRDDRNPPGLSIDGRYRHGDQETTMAADLMAGSGTVRLAGFRPRLLTALFPGLPAAAHFRCPLTVELTIVNASDGRMAVDGFSVEGGGGTFRHPALATTVPVASIASTGRVINGLKTIHLDTLTLDAGGPRLVGSGRLDRKGSQWTGLRMDAEIHQLPLEKARIFWPEGLIDPVRDWILTHFKAGAATRTEVRLKLNRNGETILPADAVSVRAHFEGIRLDYHGPLPALEDGRGEAVFSAHSADIRVDSGTLADSTVDSGRVVITGFAPDTPPGIEITGDILGPAADLLDAARSLSVGGGLAELPVTAGKAQTTISVGFPLGKSFSPDRVRVGGTSRIQDLVIDPYFGRRLDEGDLRLTLADRRITLSGKLMAGAVPVTADGVIGPDADGIRLNARLTPEDLRRWGIPCPDFVTGSAGATATLEPPLESREILFRFDLTDTGLALPMTGWEKPAGVSGTLMVQMVPGDELRFPRLHLYGDDYHVIGYGTVSDLHLTRFRLGRNDLAIHLTRKPEAGWELLLDGAELDAAPLFDADSVPSAVKGIDGAIRFQVSTVHLAGDGRLANLTGTARLHGGRPMAARLDARLPSGESVSLSLNTDADGRKLTADTGNAGELLKALGVTEYLAGGRLQLDLVPGPEGRRADTRVRPYSGALSVEDFTLLKAPSVVNILSLASFEGILEQLEGGGIPFDRLTARFSEAGSRLTLDDVRMEGPALGITARGEIDRDAGTLTVEGLLVPLNVVNRIIRTIPVVGKLITGEGIIAAAYTLTGPIDAPTVRVNPLSTLLLGPVRELFERIENGKAPPS